MIEGGAIVRSVLPGTTIETKLTDRDVAKTFLDNIFMTVGLMLSQVVSLTGIEPYVIQNWVKRGFLPRPEKKLYTKNQFCRVAIISALRESMQIDRITSLLSYINGHLDDERDDLVSDAELYNDFVNLIIACGGFRSPREIRIVIDELTADYKEPYAGARKRLSRVLEVMLYAYTAAEFRLTAENLMADFD